MEQVSSDGSLGRRLQQLDLNQLALQLSPLPVAIAVSYEPLDFASNDSKQVKNLSNSVN